VTQIRRIESLKDRTAAFKRGIRTKKNNKISIKKEEEKEENTSPTKNASERERALVSKGRDTEDWDGAS
jgi:hypothetical protein